MTQQIANLPLTEKDLRTLRFMKAVTEDYIMNMIRKEEAEYCGIHLHRLVVLKDAKESVKNLLKKATGEE